MRKQILAAAAAAALLTGFSFSADALPMSSGAPAPVYSSSPDMVLVAGGCGIGFHRGPYGGCRRNGGILRPLVRPFVGPFVGRRCVVRRGPYGGVRRFCR